jgi:hypothetical protein
MNCSDAETTLIGLARDEAIDPTLRNGAMVHARECRHCSELLSAENQLSRFLEVLRTGMQAEAASPGVEEALLKELRAGRPASVTPIQAASTLRRSSMRWVYAAAAVVLLAIGLFVAVSLLKPGNNDHRAQDGLAPQLRNDEKAGDQSPQKQQATVDQKRPDKQLPKTQKRRPNRFYDALGRGTTARGSERNDEIATDYLPVAGFSDPAELENGQILRVELPRSALLSFGLPVNPDRASERVRADVLVGSDGLARAIRFVSGSYENGR